MRTDSEHYYSGTVCQAQRGLILSVSICLRESDYSFLEEVTKLTLIGDWLGSFLASPRMARTQTFLRVVIVDLHRSTYVGLDDISTKFLSLGWLSSGLEDLLICLFFCLCASSPLASLDLPLPWRHSLCYVENICPCAHLLIVIQSSFKGGLTLLIFASFSGYLAQCWHHCYQWPCFLWLHDASMWGRIVWQ